MRNKKSSKVLLPFVFWVLSFVFLYSDVPNYKLALPKTKEEDTGEKLLVFIKNVLSKRNFPQLLEKWPYMKKDEKYNILYLSLIFRNKFTKRFIRKWLIILLKSEYLDKELLEVFTLIFADRKICSKKLQEKFSGFNVEPSIEETYKQRCK